MWLTRSNFFIQAVVIIPPYFLEAIFFRAKGIKNAKDWPDWGRWSLFSADG